MDDAWSTFANLLIERREKEEKTMDDELRNCKQEHADDILEDRQALMCQAGHETVLGVMMDIENEMLCYSDDRGGNINPQDVLYAIQQYVESELAK